VLVSAVFASPHDDDVEEDDEWDEGDDDFDWRDEDMPCEIPEKFTTRLTQVFVDKDNCASYYDRGLLYYDYPNQQARLDIVAETKKGEHNKKKDTTFWLDYHEGIAYRYDRHTDECTTSSTNGDLKKPEIPETANYTGTSMIGSQAIDTWVSVDEEDEDATVKIVSVTQGTCFLVSFVGVNISSSESTFVESFWNFIPDVPPFFFDMPQACKEARTHQNHLFAKFDSKRFNLPFN